MTVEDFDAAAATFDEDERIERARSVAAHIAGRIDLGPQTSVLDYGCGTGLLGFSLLAEIGHLTLADASTGMLREAERKIRTSDRRRVQTLPIDPDQVVLPLDYDLIVSLMTLHHIPEAESTVALLARHLRPGGSLALADLDLEDGSFHGPGAEVHAGFDRGDIRSWMASSGLGDLEESTPWIMRRERDGTPCEYPVFLITGRRYNP